MKLTLKKTALIVALGVMPVLGFSASSSDFKLNQIKFEGLNRISSKTVMEDLPVSSGQQIDEQDTSKIISELYQTGYFKDIQLYREHDNLIIRVEERPAISAINISGNDAIKTDDLKKGLRMAGLEVGDIYSPELLKQIKQSLEMEYYNLGKYAVKIDATSIPLSRNRVDVKIVISEGKTAKIRRIDIVGNKKYSQSALQDEIVLKTPSIWNAWGLLTSDDQYSVQRMQASTEKLRSFYMDRGHVDFNIPSHQVSLNPHKDNTFVTINIAPGAVYKISKVSVDGKLILPRDVIRKMISLNPGSIFSRKDLLDSSNKIKSALSKKGYAFAQVNPVPTVDQKDKTVAITFYVQPGRKVYINQINFNGNIVTNDNVYRREMLYQEGGLYNSYMIDQSRLRLQRLPYVKAVNVKSVPVAGSDDLVNLDYDIEERSANSVTASLGYSQLYKFMIGASLNMPNLIGTGNQVSLSTQLSKPYKSLSLSYTNPYFTQTGISQTVSAYITNVNTASTALASYSTDSFGFNLGYGVPLTINSILNAGVGFDHTRLIAQSGIGSSNTVNNFIADQNGKSSFNSYMANIGWTYNTANRAFFPTRGDVFNIGGQATVPGSDLKWYKLNIKNSWFFPITNFFTFSSKAGVNYGNGYGKTGQLPFFQNFYGGGWGSVRGYNQGTMGPRDALNGAPATEGNSLGGNLNVFANFDVLFPIPGVKDSSNMRLGVFFDMGNVYSTYKYQANGPTGPNSRSKFAQTPSTPTFSNLRYATGIEFQWLSPMGPLAFSIAKALNAKPGDDTQFFQFSLGQNF